ncbi:MAG TPA: 16S rRNA (cytosine(967)-C(5))-methyltransferase RsmB, partial [Actinobacteria bacterium]|nr:16S rRNA (cytosine(967)-C(5))-methyltransferase RsmB [Actinomycetota bacterium]
MSAREFAFSFLGQYEKERGHVQIKLPKALADSNLDQREKALATELVYGVLRSRLSLDWLIREFSSKKTKNPDPDIQNILRLGLYQLLYLDRVPDHAAVDTTVKIAKTHLHPSVAKFVNAILRSAGRAKGKLPWPDRDKNEALFLSVFYSHPRWLVDFWLFELGVNTTEALLVSGNERPRVTLRVNTLKTSRKKLVEVLEGYDIHSEVGQLCPESVIIKSFIPGSILDEGLVYVQNEASIAVGHIVEPSAGQTVIDLCAGPGGKTTHLAQLMENKGKIFAVDVSADRLSLIDQNSRRLGIDIIELIKGDATEKLSLEVADNVLVDAPCTGLGV